MATPKLTQVNVQVEPAHKPLLLLLGRQLRAGAIKNNLVASSPLAATIHALTLTAQELTTAIQTLHRAVSGVPEDDARTAVPSAAAVAPAAAVPVAPMIPPAGGPRFADRLRATREAKGWSRSALRDALAGALSGPPVRRQRLHDWESGRCQPTPQTKAVLCQLLGIVP